MGTLSAAQIEEKSGEIFVGGTFSAKQLRGAAYDLRIRDDDELETTGRIVDSFLHLAKGQRAVVESYEQLSMPWNLAGNIGVKARWSLRGLFVTQGLFIDPGFGWTEAENGECQADGARLRVMLTNMSDDPIVLRLGEHGDPVLGVQFFDVDLPKEQRVISERPADPQGLAIFADMTELETRVERLSDAVEEVDKSTSQVVLFGVFLVTATLLGAFVAAILAVVGSSDFGEKVVHAANEFDTSKWLSILVLVAAVFAIVTCTIRLALWAGVLYKILMRRRGVAGKERPTQIEVAAKGSDGITIKVLAEKASGADGEGH
jgi:hypothetical protein